MGSRSRGASGSSRGSRFFTRGLAYRGRGYVTRGGGRGRGWSDGSRGRNVAMLTMFRMQLVGNRWDCTARVFQSISLNSAEATTWLPMGGDIQDPTRLPYLMVDVSES